MKKEKRAVVAFLLVAILCLGIGFALLSDDLLIDGTFGWSKDAANEVFDDDVYFVNVNDTEVISVDSSSTCQDGTKITGVIGNDNNGDASDKLTITVEAGAFCYGGEVATIKAKVQNDSPEAVALAVGAVTYGVDDGLFTVTCTPASTTIGANNGTVELTITITLNSLPTESQLKPDGTLDNTARTFTIPLTATAPTA